ncbi:hypothetical protein LCGC14_2474760, partial [marine sediment metagenome]
IKPISEYEDLVRRWDELKREQQEVANKLDADDLKIQSQSIEDIAETPTTASTMSDKELIRFIQNTEKQQASFIDEPIDAKSMEHRGRLTQAYDEAEIRGLDVTQQVSEKTPRKGFFGQSIEGGAAAATIAPTTPRGPGLTGLDKLGNILTRARQAVFKTGVTRNEIATPLMKDFTKTVRLTKNRGNLIERFGNQLKNNLGADPDTGIISSLNGQDVPPATIQDIAQNFSKYKKFLTSEQIETFDRLRRDMDAFLEQLQDAGIEFDTIKFRDPEGFYLPRNVADNGKELKPQVRVANRPLGGATAGFEKPRQMPTMVSGIKAGFSYPSFNEALTKYVDSVAIRVAEKNLGKAVLKLKAPGARGRVSLFGTRDVDIPAEVSDVINSEIAKIKGIVGSEEGNLFTQINNNLRGMMAAGDASRGGIQSIPFMADNPKLALASFRAAFRTLTNPDAMAEFVKNFDERALREVVPTSDRWVSSGLEFSRASGTGTDIGGLSNIIEQKTGPFGS